MPSAEAERLTTEYQRQLLRLAGLIAKRIGVTARRVDTSDVDGWWDRVSPQVQREILLGQGALAQLARRYLRAHALAEGVQLAPVLVAANAEQVAEVLRITGPVAFKTAMSEHGSQLAATRIMATQLEGAAMRMAMEGPRQTTMRTFAERPAAEGWRRVAAGKGCPFCLMLVSRGAVYSRSSVTFRAHGHCRCSAVLVYRREPEPPHVRRLQEQWSEATTGTSGPEAVAAWRRYVQEHNL
jgi:hypothetical protein